MNDEKYHGSQIFRQISPGVWRAYCPNCNQPYFVKPAEDGPYPWKQRCKVHRWYKPVKTDEVIGGSIHDEVSSGDVLRGT